MDFDRGQNNEENNSHDFSKRDDFLTRILKYFSRDSVGIKIIFIIGILSVFLGSWKIIYGIKNSFVSSPIALKDNAATIQALNSLKDTDGDSISDYDELGIYGTSPYLADTNSNGISDYEEAVLGKGNNCTDLLSCNKPTNLSVISASSSVFGEAIDYEDIKKQMLNAGYSQEVVDKITPASQETQADLEKLKNLSIEDIKKLLIDGGATEADLSKFSDEEIKSIYNQTFDEQTSQD